MIYLDIVESKLGRTVSVKFERRNKTEFASRFFPVATPSPSSMFETPPSAAGVLQRQASDRELTAKQIRSRPRPESVRSRTSLAVMDQDLGIHQQQNKNINNNQASLIAPPSTPVRNPSHAPTFVGGTSNSVHAGNPGESSHQPGNNKHMRL